MPVNRIERYRNSEAMTADPAILVRLLLEETIRTIRIAIDHTRAGRIAERGESASRAVELLTSLMINLNTEETPGLAGGLQRLYDFCQYRVIEGHVKGDVSCFEAALPVLGDITEAWVAVLEKEKAAAEAGTDEDAAPMEVPDQAQAAWA
jgi:flagellar protein FliS